MQTKKEIYNLLAEAGIRLNKKFGQNFLIDGNLMRLLVETAGLTSEDVVLEVGCGTGSLTEELALRAGFAAAVEIDGNLAEIARNRLKGIDNVEIINTDVLSDKHTINKEVIDAIQDARKSYGGRFLLVSNLPFSAATPLMLNLICGPVVADAMYVTVQKEVAERMTAQPGGREYGILSVILDCFGEANLERILPASVFWPVPKVESAIVSFERNEDKTKRIENTEMLVDVVSMFMQHRRKMVKGTIKYAKGDLSGISNWQELFEQSGIDSQQRPQMIKSENFLILANLCQHQLNPEF